MSCLEVYGVKENGEVEHYADLRNAWQGAMKVWTDLGQKYLGTDCTTLLMSEEGARKVWDLAKDSRLSEAEWTVMLMTFDCCVVPVGQMEFCAGACEQVNIGHYGKGGVATVVREMVQKGYKGVCFNQTSVSGSPWTIHLPEDAEAEDRPYNINTDTKHWLFDRSARGKPV